MRYTHFTATANSVFNFNRFGGCKILQFVGFCCNPRRDNGKFPELCKSLQFNGYNEDIDYILLETEVGDADEDNNICCFGKGKWYTIDELRAMNLNAEQTQIDTIIAMSPQHERMVEVFRQLGYQYVIGVESPKNTLKFSTTETAAFLEQFYAALLEQRSVSRAFYLSLQAALSTRGGNVRGGLDHDDKYLLTIDESLRDARFIVFADDQLEFGEIIDKSQHEKLPKTNLTEPVRPFIGRTSYVIKLLKYLIEHRILNVTGKELVGRASVVKSTTRYLLQMGFFRGGCFVIDCNISRKYQQKNKSFNEYVYDVLKFCGVNFKDPNNNHGHHHTTNLTGIQGINENEEDPDEEIIDEDDVPQMNGGYGSNGIFQGISNSTNHSVQSSADDHQVDDAQLTANNLNLTTNNSNVNTPMSRNARHSHYSSRSSVKFPPVSKIIGNGHEAATPSITSNNNNGYNALLSPAPSQIASPIVSTPTVNNYGMYCFI